MAKARGRPSKSAKAKTPQKKKEVVKDADHSGSDAEESEKEEPKAKVEPALAKKKAESKSSKKGAAKPKSDEENGAEEEDEEVAVVKSKAKAGKKGKSTPASKPSPKKSASKRGRPTSVAASSKKAKNEASDDDEGDDDEDEEYEVDRILEVKFMKGGNREFLIKWKGYGEKDATWEPEENLQCKELLAAFTDKLEVDNLPRTRRLRPSTVQNSRSSASATRQLQNVHQGRVTKSRSRSRNIIVHNSYTLVDEVRRINGEIKEISKTEHVTNETYYPLQLRGEASHGDTFAKKLRRTLLRPAVFGVAISIGAAILLSSSSTISWEKVSQPALQVINRLREQVRNKWTSSSS